LGTVVSFSLEADNNDACRKNNFLDPVSIVLVGKYTDMPDSYMSVVKSLEHSASRCRRKLDLKVTLSFYNDLDSLHHVVGCSGALGAST
jgi:CTP synthase (UTP-ammonia lyase)